jgi:hypothetical protein
LSNSSKSTSRQWRSFPSLRLDTDAPVGRALRDHNVRNLHEALDFVWQLPYHRNVDPSDPLAPLKEGCGTSGTKHALLLRMSREIRFVVNLRLAFFYMNEVNTPEVAGVLKDAGLASIPESRCFLRRVDRRIDVTHPNPAGMLTPPELFGEETIRPEQVLDYKHELHRGIMERWSHTDEAAGLTPDELWAVRESCIRVLSGEPASDPA